jgi:hypothetical protein
MGIILKRESVFDIVLVTEIIKRQMEAKGISLFEVDDEEVQKKYDEAILKFEKMLEDRSK